MRYLRTSQLWQSAFQRGIARAREQLELRRKAAARDAIEEARQKYQADPHQQLAWVDAALAQPFIDSGPCPVCPVAGGLPWGPSLRLGLQLLKALQGIASDFFACPVCPGYV